MGIKIFEVVSGTVLVIEFFPKQELREGTREEVEEPCDFCLGKPQFPCL